MSDQVVQRLLRDLGPDFVKSGIDIKDRYEHIWRMNEPLNAKAVVFPRTTEQVSKTLSICHELNQPVSVHGGLTGLTGATITQPEEIVITLEKMNQIEEVDEYGRTMTVQAGVILEEIQNAAVAHNMLFPLNFGAKGTAQIGGIIATNAGGLRVLKFGMTRQLILGIEAVLPNGTIISSLKKIIKDNAGYDLKQLFIGSEGTLGIVTRAVLKLTEAPTTRLSAFIGTASYAKVVQLLKYLDSGLGGRLSGFELIWKSCYKAMTSPPALMKPPIPHGYNYYVLVELLGTDHESDQNKLEALLEEALENELIEDAALANSESDLNWFWTIREDVHVFISKYEFQQHFDISLPIPLIGETINRITDDLANLDGVIETFAFGHVADSNIHLIVGKKNPGEQLTLQINDIIYNPLKPINGSVSAEHGIGLHKKRYLPISRSPEEIEMMKLLKRSIDPKNLLNRGRVLDI